MSTDVINVILSICYLILVIDRWVRWRMDRLIERKIQKMWAVAKVIGNPLHQGAVREMAAILDIELEETDGND